MNKTIHSKLSFIYFLLSTILFNTINSLLFLHVLKKLNWSHMKNIRFNILYKN